MSIWYSISDDDLCASCKHLAYFPGEHSTCTEAGNDWPATFNEDGYSVECPKYERCKPGENYQFAEAHSVQGDG